MGPCCLLLPPSLLLTEAPGSGPRPAQGLGKPLLKPGFPRRAPLTRAQRVSFCSSCRLTQEYVLIAIPSLPVSALSASPAAGAGTLPGFRLSAFAPYPLARLPALQDFLCAVRMLEGVGEKFPFQRVQTGLLKSNRMCFSG